MKKIDVDVVIVGAGPAGLMTYKYLRESNSDMKIALVDIGSPDVNDFHTPEGRVTGPGGAGVTSDGKFSWGCSATKLGGVVHYEQSVDYVYSMLHKRYNMPAVPNYKDREPCYDEKKWRLKKYPTVYIQLEDRIRFVKDVMAIVDMRLAFFNQRAKLLPKKDKHQVELSGGTVLRAEHVVLAGGRFGPVSAAYKQVPWVYRRVEIGVRIETDLEHVPRDFDGLNDPKAKCASTIKNRDCEYRIFCYCRDGEVAKTTFPRPNGPITTYSGHSDCASTGKVNHGINVRFHDEISRADIARMLHAKPFEGPALDNNVLFQAVHEFGSYGAHVGVAIADFLFAYDIPTRAVKIYGPVIEGVGYYPRIDESTLEVDGISNLYVPGDMSGIFRGIVAAMTSGISVAKQILTRRALLE